MSCFYPRQALRLDSKTKSGKSVVRFIDNQAAYLQMGNPNLLSGLPCGQCTGCRLERSRQWAIRMCKEAELYQDNCFITLTFDEEHLHKRDRPLSLEKREFQLFLKRLRKKFVFRYFMCGEYGELFRRPHYHAILFGIDFPDKVLEKDKDGMRYYSSEILKSFWSYGSNLITDVNFDTCAYVARYIMKKHLGKNAERFYYDYFDDDTGEFVGHRIPEYTTMSRRPGIGKAWLDRYLVDVYPKDKIFMRGRGYSRPPKYFDTQFEIVDPNVYSSIKKARIESALSVASDNTPERLTVKQVCKLAKINILKRNLE